MPQLRVPTRSRSGLKPVVKGAKDAYFESSVTDWDGKYHHLIGTSTRDIVFGARFVLTDDHIDDILVMPRPLRCKERCQDVTDEAVVRLAKGLPGLRTVLLPSANRVNDKGFLALVSHCPDLRLLELTAASTGSLGSTKLSPKALEELCAHPEWAPGLKQLVITTDEENKEFMKAMRALGKQREKLVITLLSRSEEKKWGDWEISTISNHYMKGRKCEPEKTPRGILHRYGRGF
ncbi:hypothetical protein FOXG_19111 [Fusarium oxysporum f. sp. lycopersici 4287]|uniref:F-box domain-containing protein n=1 Tax=Fusarium oxysporum f. sp. lycopersici (strain 4287 / CBS 123668 / FGSC 9935 / NRRL 34936) TaxID=426428 RepID=A0A0J9UXD0_FUSO4|nr:hypothetical protein FOXG_19111 [Fusarium oxysporum f. sp. lycopersici 4287]KNB03186.1 hypothetical protein FOXG_19111 [Fusarium oxysporum f. sp. lycopersici 4287]